MNFFGYFFCVSFFFSSTILARFRPGLVVRDWGEVQQENEVEKKTHSSSLWLIWFYCVFFCFKNGGWLKSISWRGPHSAESCLRTREKKTRGILSVLTRRDREIPVKSARLIISSQSSTRDPHVRIQHLHTHTHTRITSLTRLWTSWRAE